MNLCVRSRGELLSGCVSRRKREAMGPPFGWLHLQVVSADIRVPHKAWQKGLKA